MCSFQFHSSGPVHAYVCKCTEIYEKMVIVCPDILEALHYLEAVQHQCNEQAIAKRPGKDLCHIIT